MSFSERVNDSLGEAVHRRGGTLVADFVEGLTAELQATDALLGPTDRGWSPMHDLDVTPQPDWLGRALGVTVPPDPNGLTVEQVRDVVRAGARRTRGTLGLIAAAVFPLLTGTQAVGITERAGSAWRLLMVVYDSETTHTAEEIAAAATPQKPIGVVLTVELVSGGYAVPTRWHYPDVDHVSYARMNELSTTYADALADFGLYSDAINYEEP